MNETQLADLNDIQDFFNRSHSTSVSGTFNTEQIDIKDFIKWCNDPCNNISGNCSSDEAYRLGQTICVLDKLDIKMIDKIYNILKETASHVIVKTDLNSLSYREKNKISKELIEETCLKLSDYDELISRLKGNWGTVTEDMKNELPVNTAFYCVLKLSLKDCPDERGYYHYQFDDSGNTIARVDPLKPFAVDAGGTPIVDKKGKPILDQQWHMLISVLALYDAAHVLSSEQHEYHCLYPYLISYDKGDLNKMRLKLKSALSLEATPEIGRVAKYSSDSMMTWIKNALVK